MKMVEFCMSRHVLLNPKMKPRLLEASWIKLRHCQQPILLSAATSTVTADLEKYPSMSTKKMTNQKESIAALMTMIEYYTQSHAMPRLKIWLRQQMMLLSKQHLWLRQT